VSNCFTKHPVWAVIVSNPKRRIKTGGASELWVLAGAQPKARFACAVLILGVQLANSGDISQQVSQQLGLFGWAGRGLQQECC
jgi:inner membrane protein